MSCEPDIRLESLLRIAALQKKRLILSGLCAIIAETLGMVPFLIIYDLVQLLTMPSFGNTDHRAVYNWLIVAFLAMILRPLFLSLSGLLSHLAAYDILYEIRRALIRKVNTLPLGFFSRRNTGQLKKVISEDVEQLEIFLAHNFPDFIAAIVYMCIATIVLFLVDWRLAIATTLVIPAGLVLQLLIMQSGREFLPQWLAAADRMNAVIIEFVQGMPIIKAFNSSRYSYTKFTDSINDCHQLEQSVSHRWHLPMALFTVSITANMMIILPLGVYLHLVQNVGVDKLVFFIVMGIGYGRPVLMMIQFGRTMEHNIECRKRISSLMKEQALVEPNYSELAGETVVAEAVGFCYDTQRRILDSVEFNLPAGSFTAVVGSSGAGKTTLARLISRFWDVDSGAIKLGDSDIRSIRSEDLMKKYAWIFQNTKLFDDTVLANLRFAAPDASFQQIEEAARAARCHDFIMRLPQGYETRLGEKGARISGGEKQRIAIARTLLKDAPILILDEATAFIDPENEVLIQQALNELVAGKTLFVIAHRLSTITDADQIIVLNRGCVEAIGQHSELLISCELYKKMWRAHKGIGDCLSSSVGDRPA